MCQKGFHLASSDDFYYFTGLAIKNVMIPDFTIFAMSLKLC